MSAAAEVRDELRAVAREMLGRGAVEAMADAGWLGLEVAEDLGGSGATFAEVAVIVEEMGRAAASTPYLGTAVLGAGALDMLDAPDGRAGGRSRPANPARGRAAIRRRGELLIPAGSGRRAVSLDREAVVADAPAADQLLVLARDPDGLPVIVAAKPGEPGLRISERPMVDASREFAASLPSGCP